MRLSPDTTIGQYKNISTFFNNNGGYYYGDTFIKGFSHTHLQGAGASDFENFLVTVTRKLNNKMIINSNYKSRFSHKSEVFYLI